MPNRLPRIGQAKTAPPNGLRRNISFPADALSRDRPIATEWALDTDSFQWILSLGVRPQVDLFATRENHKLPLYVSPILDKKAIGIDALRIDWNSWKTLYLFPPVKMMPQVLLKLESFAGLVVLVAPYWPNQSWFPRLQRMCESPRRFPHPVLTQTVQGMKHTAGSFLTSALRVWIFYVGV